MVNSTTKSARTKEIVFEMMVGALLPLAFFIPVLFAMRILEWSNHSDFGKVSAALLGVILFVALKAFYLWAGHQVIQKFKS